MENEEVKIAKAVRGFRRVVVKDCPYCHKEHSHSTTSEEGQSRMADCLLGEYVLTFKSEKSE